MKMVDQSLLSTKVSQIKLCSSGLSRLVWQQVTFTFLLTSQMVNGFSIQFTKHKYVVERFAKTKYIIYN